MRYDAPLSIDSLLLSLKAQFDSVAAAGLDATIALHLGEHRFGLRIAGGRLTITRGEIDRPDAVLDTDPPTLLSLLRTQRPLQETLASGQLHLTETEHSLNDSGACSQHRNQSRPQTAPSPHTRTTVLVWLVAVHTKLYQATGGRIGHRAPGMPAVLLLDHETRA
jgi:hypothetical protein